MSSPNIFNNLALSPPSANFQIEFLRNIQWLLESSSYNSTYKFALIIALSNLSIESGMGDRRSLTLSYEQVAEQLLNLYWRQTLPYSAGDENSILSQTVNNGQIKVIKCFYCHKDLKKTVEVDHFIPWSKYPIDTIHNFVLADHGYNNKKRDYLAEERFYEQWLLRNQNYGEDIAKDTQAMGFISNQQRSETISSWAYQIAVEHNDLVWTPDSELKLRTIDPHLLPKLRH